MTQHGHLQLRLLQSTHQKRLNPTIQDVSFFNIYDVRCINFKFQASGIT